MNPPLILEKYLGDGVYAEFDGFSVKLKTQRWPDNKLIEHYLIFEPNELASLKQFIAQVEAFWAERDKESRAILQAKQGT